MLTRAFRLLFHGLIVRPVLVIIFGLNVRHRERLPTNGPAIIVANHNSHLDTVALMSLFPLRQVPHVRPVAAMDYFLRNRLLAWFVLNLIGIIPIDRAARERGEDPLLAPGEALTKGEVLILFPEGTRGNPEELRAFKKGVSYLAERHPDTPVYPVFLHGFGKAWPKGDWLPVPFFLDVFVGEPLVWQGDREAFMGQIKTRIDELGAEGHFAQWD